MDIGTNSIRLLVVKIVPNQPHKVLLQLKETVRLGEGEFANQMLQPQAVERAVLAAREFAQAARSAGAREIIAVATSATRDATNRDEFLERLRREAKIEVQVISGKEEARLIYLGVTTGLNLEGRRVLCIDIGGGSTEVILGDHSGPLHLASLPLGAIRLTTQFLADFKGPIPQHLYDEIRTHIHQSAASTLWDLGSQQIDLAIGSSGTIENLAEIAARMFYKRPNQASSSLRYAHLKEVIESMRSLPLDVRRKTPGLNPSRADIIIAGSAILDTLMDALSIPEIQISDYGLRDGLLIDYIRNGQSPRTPVGTSVI
jgi:exopolyphosphatase/guanosine-5'-triphosphate,3'-diphosphate pyrophosphatase